MRRVDRHPGERTLSLLAGGDLGPLRRHWVGHHVSRCAPCSASVESYRRIRDQVALEARVPEVDFGALARQVQAAAAVRTRDKARWQWGWRTAVGTGAVAGALVAIALVSDWETVPSQPTVPTFYRQGLPQVATLPVAPAEAQLTSEGWLSVRSFDAASGTLTITDYFAP